MEQKQNDKEEISSEDSTEREETSMKAQQMSSQEYARYVKQITPTHNTLLNVIKAFLVGGIICTVGQAIMT